MGMASVQFQRMSEWSFGEQSLRGLSIGLIFKQGASGDLAHNYIMDDDWLIDVDQKSAERIIAEREIEY